jgi:GNAT superfamily N-acetyltransferase
VNATKSQTPVLDLVRDAQAAGWRHEPPGRHGTNPNALPFNGATLVGDGVRVCVGSLLLYYHDGRVWRGCPVTDASETRVVVEAIVVDPDRRRHGVATLAVRALQELAAGLGLELWLEATPIEAFKAKGLRTITTRQLVLWYKGLGFVDAYPGEGDRILKWSKQ